MDSERLRLGLQEAHRTGECFGGHCEPGNGYYTPEGEREWLDEPSYCLIPGLILELEGARLEAERLQNTGVRADERREMQKAVAEALAAEMRATKAEAEAEELRGLAKAAQMNYIEESLEAEAFKAAAKTIADEMKMWRGIAQESNPEMAAVALEAERLRLNFKRITGWDDEQLDQGMIHLEEAAMVKARRLAGTEVQG